MVMRIFLSRLLELGGYEPVPAGTSEKGLERVEQQRADLIVLAVLFDRKGILQLLDELEMDDRFKHIPVVLLSTMDKSPCISSGPFPERPGEALRRVRKAFCRSPRRRTSSWASFGP